MNLADLHSLPPTLTADQVAKILGIGRNQAYELARSGQLPVLKLGRTLRFPTARILALLGIDYGPGPPGKEEEPGTETGPSTNPSGETDWGEDTTEEGRT